MCNLFGKLVDRALHLPLKPIHNAVLVELAQALKTGQGLPNLVVLHTYRALRCLAILTEAVLLRGHKWKHAGCWRRARQRRTLLRG